MNQPSDNPEPGRPVSAHADSQTAPPADSRPGGAETAPAAEMSEQPAPGRLRSPALMSRHDTALLVIDVQQKLVPHIDKHPVVIWNIRRLLEAARVLGLPRLCTEQYPRGLGNTVPELADLVSVDDEKTGFSCRECEHVARRLADEGIQKVLLCGIETHVCVQQTALDFLAAGIDVWLAADGCGTRHPLDHQIALGRMDSAGITLTTTESALFEWCEVSDIPEFRKISALVRQQPPALPRRVTGRELPDAGARYVLQNRHTQTTTDEGNLQTDLCYIVRRTDTADVVGRFEGRQIESADSPGQTLSCEGITAVDLGADGTSLSLRHANQQIEMNFLPVGEPRTSHPRWKVRRLERHINSPEYQTDYELTFQVIEYATGEVFREFQGFEHRRPDGSGLSHASGVRQVEVSGNGQWMLITAVGRTPELMALPAEWADSGQDGDSGPPGG